MKPSVFMSSMLAVGLFVTSPSFVFAHVGHGDEFQAEGGIDRVQVNPETDSILGIQVTPIEQASDVGVLIPVSALVESDGKQLVFVQYENFYEPVPVTTGATEGDLIAITEGLSVGEQLVTQGSLSLYAESRKTQSAETAAENVPAETASATDEAHKKADAEGTPHSHDADGNLVAEADETTSFPIGLAIVIGGVAALGIGAVAVMKSGSSANKSKGA